MRQLNASSQKVQMKKQGGPQPRQKYKDSESALLGDKFHQGIRDWED